MMISTRTTTSITQESYGLLLLFVSAILYSMAGVFVKLAASNNKAGGPLASSELVLLRALFQGALVVIGLCLYRETDAAAAAAAAANNNNNTNKRLIWQPFGATRDIQSIVILRGMMGATGFCLYFYTIAALPLGDATALIALKPIPTIFLGRLCLGEPIRGLHIMVTVLSILGSLLIARPSFIFANAHQQQQEAQQDSPSGLSSTSQHQTPEASWGHVTGLLGACAAASVVILIRKAGSIGAHTLQLLFSWAFFDILFSSAILWWQQFSKAGHREQEQQQQPQHYSWKWPATTTAWFYVVALSVLGAAAHFLLNYASQLATASLGSIVRSSDMMFAYIWEMLVFHQIPDKYTWMGVALIALSLGLIAIDKVRGHHHPRDEISVMKRHASDVQKIMIGEEEGSTFDMDDDEIVLDDVELPEVGVCMLDINRKMESNRKGFYTKVALSETS